MIFIEVRKEFKLVPRTFHPFLLGAVTLTFVLVSLYLFFLFLLYILIARLWCNLLSIHGLFILLACGLRVEKRLDLWVISECLAWVLSDLIMFFSASAIDLAWVNCSRLTTTENGNPCTSRNLVYSAQNSRRVNQTSSGSCGNSRIPVINKIKEYK